MKRLFGPILVSAMLLGCASTQNLKDGSSMLGGFSEEQLRPGLYEMRSVGGYMPFSSARATWGKRADQLCGKDQYHEISVTTSHDSTGQTMVAIRPGVFIPVAVSKTTLNGYVLCNASPLGKDEAVKFVEGLPALRKKAEDARQQAELDKLGGADCSLASDKDSPETLYQRSKILMSQSQYKAVMVCLQKAVGYGEQTSVYRDACAAIGELHELGFGVPASLGTAKEWYGKAGLL